MVCKFCGYECPDSEAIQCSDGYYYDDEGNYAELHYCGNLECPGCTFCQGRTDTTPEQIQCAKRIREIRGK